MKITIQMKSGRLSISEKSENDDKLEKLLLNNHLTRFICLVNSNKRTLINVNEIESVVIDYD